ncbi:MAG TPA: DegT/DnrJ/EryC1/StrS family aminotransferase [Candidatus Koribacter sp.]
MTQPTNPATTNSTWIPFHAAAVGEEEVAAVAEAIRSGWLTMGPRTVEFEKQFAEYVGAKHAVAVSSCTAALHLAYDAIGLKAQDEVLVPSITFAATAEAVIYFGATPVIVDVDRQTLNISVQDLERKITPRTKAIVPVHYAGQPCDMEEIKELAARRNLRIIEDAAHAVPASYRGTPVGAISEVTCFSFYATKTLATGEGGMVTTDNEDIANRVRLMRSHGIGRDAWKRYSAAGSWYYEIVDAGYKYNMTDIQAAMGLVQLRKCDAMRQQRAAISSRYDKAFGTLLFFEIPTLKDDRESALHLYPLRLNLETLTIDRARFIEELKQRAIGTSVHFIPLHMHPFYRDNYGYTPHDLPVSAHEYERYFSLPFFPTMTDEQINHVIENVIQVAKAHQR